MQKANLMETLVNRVEAVMDPTIHELFLAAKTALASEAWMEAKKKLDEILQLAPTFVPALIARGNLLSHANDKKAEYDFKQAVTAAPGNGLVWHELANFYSRNGQFDYAKKYLQQAIKVDPQNPALVIALIKVAKAQKDNHTQLALLNQLINRYPQDTSLRLQRIDVLEAQKIAEALTQEITADITEKILADYKVVLDQPKLSSKVLEKWTNVMIECNRCEEAKKRLEPLANQTIDNSGPLSCLGKIYSHEGDQDKALQCFKQALDMYPNDPQCLHDYAVMLRYVGQLEASKRYFNDVLDKDPFNTGALRIFGLDHQYTLGDEPYRRLMKALSRYDEYQVPAHVQLNYALAKVYEDTGDLELAIQYYIAAGRIQKKLIGYQGLENEGVEKYDKQFTKEFFRNKTTIACEDERPIFIVGMPRSGTSLTEQVLASHPDVFGAGELKTLGQVLEGIVVGNLKIEMSQTKHFNFSHTTTIKERGEAYMSIVEKLADSGYKRIVDKMPANFAWLGFIDVMLPNSKIIHCVRHPVETCLSCFRIFFPDGQGWSYDLRDLGKFYRHYHELMKLWRERMPAGRFLDVRYEDMVADLDTQAKKIISYIDLPWNEQCLRFHETERPVRTASAAQVRQPIYTTSINRWRKYEAYLKPLLDELGPLVQEYENGLAKG